MRRSSNTSFADWLARVLQEQGVSRRELARRLAAKHPAGANESTIDSARTTIGRILRRQLNPSQPTRDAIMDSLGDNSAPTVEGEARDEPLTRAELVDLLRRSNRALRMLAREVEAA